MLGLSVRDKIRKEIIRERTRITDIMRRVDSLKKRWVGHVAKQDSER